MEEIFVGSLTLLEMNSSIGNGRHHKHKNILKTQVCLDTTGRSQKFLKFAENPLCRNIFLIKFQAFNLNIY